MPVDLESDEDAITDDGILDLCGELEVDAQDPVMLVLSYVMEAETMCVFSRAEFVRGFQKLHCRTLQDLKDQLPLLRRKLQNLEQFTSIYSVRACYHHYHELYMANFQFEVYLFILQGPNPKEFGTRNRARAVGTAATQTFQVAAPLAGICALSLQEFSVQGSLDAGSRVWATDQARHEQL